jgi:general stress protein 26
MNNTASQEVIKENERELPYEVLEQELIEVLDKNKFWVLATSVDDRVTARTIVIANDGLKIYFQSEMVLDKCRQIAKNPQVALCMNHVQIEGSAEFKGHVSSQENQAIRENYCKHKEANKAYERWCYLDQQAFIEVQPTVITVWKLIDSKPCRDFLYVNERKAIRRYYHPEAYEEN